jgi:hypothetical protein
MDRQIVLSVLARRRSRLPRRPAADACLHPGRHHPAALAGSSRTVADIRQVFGFTIGETTLTEVRELFGDDGKVNLFQDPGT